MSGYVAHSRSCDHCRHTERGCFWNLFCLVATVALIFGAYMLVIFHYRWTSIEGDCIVEKRLYWERTESGDETDVVQRICPALREDDDP